MTHEIVVSRRDGILTTPDGTKHRVARGKTLADADHPAVLANPGDWVPMVVSLTVSDRARSAAALPSEADDEDRAELLAELEETLSARDAELTRLAEGLTAAGIELPAEDDREPGWLVDLALTYVRAGAIALRVDDEPEEPAAPAPIAPPKPRKRTSPPLTTRTGDDG